MALSTYEMALKYYPKYWNKKRLQMLVALGKLNEEEYQKITGEEYNS